MLGFLAGVGLANAAVCLPKAPFAWCQAPLVATGAAVLLPILIFSAPAFLRKHGRQQTGFSFLLFWRGSLIFFMCGVLLAFLQSPTALPKGIFYGEVRVVAEADAHRLEVAVPDTGRLRENHYLVQKRVWSEAKPGARYRGNFRVRPFSHALFPGDFDVRKYAAYRGWAGELIVEDAVRENAQEMRDLQWGDLFDRFRRTIRTHLQASLAAFPGESASFLQRLFLAEKNPADALQGQMRDLGVAHLLAVSGLHVRILFQWGQWLLAFFPWRRSRCSVVLFLFLFFYAWLLDFPASVGRAIIFLAFREIAILSRWRLHRRRRLCAALCFLLCFRPYALLDTGLQLSFACSTALDVFPEISRKEGRGLAAQLEFALFLTLCTFPLQFHLFGRFAPVCLLANLFVIPFFTPLFACGLLAICLQHIPLLTGLLRGGFYGGFLLFSALLEGLQALSIPIWEQPGGLFPQQTASVLLVGILFVAHRRGALRTCLPMAGGLSNLRGRKLFQARCLALQTGFFLWVVAAFGQHFVPFSTTFTMLDVGQGDAFLLESKNAVILFDVCGKRDFRTGADQQGKKFTALLQRRGITHIDAIFLSHPDVDHCGNAAAVLEAFPDARVFTAPQTEPLYETSMLPARRIGVHHGQTWQNRDFSLTVLRAGSLSGDSNAGSMCLRLTLYPRAGNRESGISESSALESGAGKRGAWEFGAFGIPDTKEHRPLTLLLTGDLPSGPEEERLVEGVSNRRGALVLKISHHGSRSGTAASFLARLQPDLALISCGEGNRYGHPHKELLERLAAADCPVWRTDEKGEMSLWEANGHWRAGFKKPPLLERPMENLLLLFYGIFLGIRARH